MTTTRAKLSRICQSSGVGEFCSPADLGGGYRKCLPPLVAETMLVDRGSVLWRQGEQADTLYWVRSGALKSTRSSECISESVTGLWLPGDLVGLGALCTGQRTDTLTALVTSEVALMPTAALIEQAGRNGGLMTALMSLLSREILRHEEHMTIMGKATSQQRVALFLIGLMARSGSEAGQEAVVDLYMTRDEIAAFLGLRMETVTRRLRELHHRGIIALSGRRVFIRDLDALAQSACLISSNTGQTSSSGQGGAVAREPPPASSHGRSY